MTSHLIRLATRRAPTLVPRRDAADLLLRPAIMRRSARGRSVPSDQSTAEFATEPTELPASMRVEPDSASAQVTAPRPQPQPARRDPSVAPAGVTEGSLPPAPSKTDAPRATLPSASAPADPGLTLVPLPRPAGSTAAQGRPSPASTATLPGTATRPPAELNRDRRIRERPEEVAEDSGRQRIGRAQRAEGMPAAARVPLRPDVTTVLQPKPAAPADARQAAVAAAAGRRAHGPEPEAPIVVRIGRVELSVPPAAALPSVSVRAVPAAPPAEHPDLLAGYRLHAPRGGAR